LGHPRLGSINVHDCINIVREIHVIHIYWINWGQPWFLIFNVHDCLTVMQRRLNTRVTITLIVFGISQDWVTLTCMIACMPCRGGGRLMWPSHSLYLG
jgi:hypothetical protein